MTQTKHGVDEGSGKLVVQVWYLAVPGQSQEVCSVLVQRDNRKVLCLMDDQSRST